MKPQTFFLLLGFLLFRATTPVHATTFEQTYIADGRDHSVSVYINGTGTHSFFVNGVPYGTYNYAAYWNTGSGSVEFWSDRTAR